MKSFNHLKQIGAASAMAVLFANFSAQASDDVIERTKQGTVMTLAAAHNADPAAGNPERTKPPPAALGAPGADIPSTTDSSTTASSVIGDKREFGTSTGAATASSGMATDFDRGDRTMMEQMAYANMAEVSAAGLAVSNSENPQVIQFAQKMLTDHQKSMKELHAFAQLNDVRLPKQPDPQHQAAMLRMKSLTGREFDEAYLEQNVTDHRNTLRQLGRTAENAENQQLRQMASSMIPMIEEHLMLAERLAGIASKSQPRDMQRNVPPAAQ